MTRRYIDNEPTFACRLCRDTGWLNVWHHRTVFLYIHTTGKLATDDRLRGLPDSNRFEFVPGRPRYDAKVPCECEKGEFFVDRSRYTVTEKDENGNKITRHEQTLIGYTEGGFCIVTGDGSEIAQWWEFRHSHDFNNEYHEWKPNVEDYAG